MRTTIKDIARACGVSTAAVSLALSGKSKRVSEATAQKILETAKRLNYHPNRLASNLAKGESQTIGLVLNDLRNAHIAELYMAISPILLRNGFSPICHVFSELDAGEQSEELLRQVVSENLCALIWARPFEPGKEAENRLIRETIDPLGIPVFTMDAYEFDSPGINLCIDYRKAAKIAVAYLLQCGHVRIGCIAGNRGFKVTADRIEGYRQALTEAGLPYDERLIYFGDYTMESGSQALSYLLGKGVTAVFSMNDEMAFGVYRSARSYHVRIPEDLSIIGCDNVPYDEVLEVPLTTAGGPTSAMGQFLAEEICRAVGVVRDEGLEALGERRTVYYQPDLYVRGSVARIGGCDASEP